jgi:hypothetical protein
MNRRIGLAALFLFSSMGLFRCAAPTVVTPPVQPPVITVPPSPTNPSSIDSIVVGSACSKYSWKNRGVAKIGYIKGMAHSYVRSSCRMNSVMAKTNGAVGTDALANYGIKGATEKERIKKLYTLLIGLGMRESSGFYGEGRDTSASNVTSETAETGLFQFSYNLRSASPELAKIYEEYKADESKCMLSIFKEGNARIPKSDFYGTGEGRYFQELTRRCPAFAAEYTAIGVRTRVAHWGPLKRGEAEYKAECEQMLTKIEENTVCAL